MNPDKHYYGPPCKYGHDGLRYRSTKACVYCRYESTEKYRSGNREIYRQNYKRWRENNREYNCQRAAHWRSHNPDKVKQYSEKQRKERKTERVIWETQRRSRKKRAIPVWYEEDKCKRVYEKANELGLEVDHIVPLQSDIVSGLHCWDNLQLLDKSSNSEKGNRNWPDMPGECYE